MSNKNKQTQTQEQRQEERLGIETGSETAEQKVARLTAELKAARGAAKATKASRPCAQAGCKLFAMEGLDVCSNHRPALSKLTGEEQTALSTWLEGLTPNELLHAYVEAQGWAKAKAFAHSLQTTKQ